MFCGHTYAKLGATFPSSGGPVEFLIRGFGSNLLSGTLNVVLWFGYILALALYASAFGGYAVALFSGGGEGAVSGGWLKPVVSVSVVVGFLVLNIVGSAAVGRAESVIVAIKLAILLGFVAITAFFIQPDLLLPANWKPMHMIVFSFGTTFLAFEGFGLITNAAGDMADPRTTLPRAIYLSIGTAIVVYILVAIAAFGNLSVDAILEKKEYALAAAAEPALGHAGFIAMGVAALFSTASAINATLFGGANVSFKVAHERQLPEFLDRKIWQGARAGLFVTAALVALLAAFVPLSAIANTGSAAFLVVYGFVCVSHLRLLGDTKASPVPVWCAIIGCATVLMFLLTYLVRSDVGSAIGFVVLLATGFCTEWVYSVIRGKTAEPQVVD